MWKAYLHDGTFEGLLTAIFEAFHGRERPEEICREGDYRPSLATAPVHVETDRAKADRVCRGIREKISPSAFEKVTYAYLSEMEGAGMAIYDYLRLGFKLGAEVNLHVSSDAFLAIDRLERKVRLERHRMLSFVRFKAVGDFFYGAIEPDHAVLSLIMGHFCARLPEENFILHDVRRELAFFHRPGASGFAPLTRKEAAAFLESTEDGFYESLWREFFTTIAVEGRTNPRLQKNFMPVRYWKHLTEMK